MTEYEYMRPNGDIVKIETFIDKYNIVVNDHTLWSNVDLETVVRYLVTEIIGFYGVK